MIQRGQMELDDPVAKYLPRSVKMPTCRNTRGRKLEIYQNDPKADLFR